MGGSSSGYLQIRWMTDLLQVLSKQSFLQIKKTFSIWKRFLAQNPLQTRGVTKKTVRVKNKIAGRYLLKTFIELFIHNPCDRHFDGTAPCGRRVLGLRTTRPPQSGHSHRPGHTPAAPGAQGRRRSAPCLCGSAAPECLT